MGGYHDVKTEKHVFFFLLLYRREIFFCHYRLVYTFYESSGVSVNARERVYQEVNSYRWV